MSTPAVKPAAAPPPAPSRLGRLVKGKLTKPIRLVLYGTDGLGKSTFASNAPSPIFIGSEDGTAQLDVQRMPDQDSWRDILDSVDELSSTDHGFKTIVLDTADWAEPLCWDFIVKSAGKSSIEDLPYGRGYTAALDQWRIFLSRCERARKRGMNVIVLAHSVIRTFKNPVQEVGDFDRHEMKLHSKTSGLLREWADAVLFGDYETFSVTDDKKRTRGISNGARVVHTERRAAWDAKNRFDLPLTLPLDWEAFAEAVAAHRPADPALLKARIAELLAYAEDPIKLRVQAAVARVGDDAAELARIHNKLSATVTIPATDTTETST